MTHNSELMDQNRRESDLNRELCLSLYGNSRKLKPQRIKTYALYKQLSENTKSVDNFVIAANDTNEISVSFNGGSNYKVFTFDKVFYSDVSQTELFDSVGKSTIQDVIMGLNNFLIICKLASPYIMRPIESKISFLDMDCIDNMTINFLKELLLFAKKEENMDSSIHVSYYEVHDEKIIDLLSSCHEYRDMKVFEDTEQNCIEVQDLVEKTLVDDKDIFELFTKQSYSLVCYANCCHSILSVSLVTKNINCDGFENIRVGKLTMVGFAKCKSFLGDANKNSEDFLLKFAENHEIPTSMKSKIFDILRPAFGRNAQTSIIVLLPSVLYSLEKDLSILQFVSEVRKTLNYPEIDLKPIIPNSLKEYAEEIKDLQKDFNATCKGTGIMIENLMYRFYKNSLSLENEKVKTLNTQLLCLTDAINARKQQLISFHASNETKENEVKEVEKSSEILNLDLEKMKNGNNVKQKASLKADEIITMKQMKITYELYRKKLKLELIKTNRNYEELLRNIHCLKGEMTSLLCDIDAEKTSLRSTLELLMVDMNNTLADFQILEEDLYMKLNNLSDIDGLLKIWKQNIENLLSKFSSFLHEHDQNFSAIKLEMSSSLAPLHTSENAILEIIRNSRKEKGPVLSYYFGKVQIFCDSSFKILAEIMHQLDLIQSSYKAEFKAIGAALCSSSQAFKKFHSDISISLKSFQQYFEEQEKELLQMTDMIYFHHKFKKQFDEKIGDTKHSLLALKQMCLGHNDATSNKWSEVQKDCHKTMQKHIDLSEHLSVIYKEMTKYVDNLAQQKLNTLECSPLKDKTDNVESRIYQLLQIHKEMKGVTGEAFEVHKKGTDKELLHVKAYINSQKAEVEKYFDTFSLQLKASSRYFLDELRSIQQVFSNNRDELKKNLDSLLSSISCLATIYNNYKSVFSSILEKSERSFKIMPPVSEDKNDNMPDFDSLILDEWTVVTSTPNVPEKKELNLSYEKEKLLCRVKSVVEQQISQKLTIRDIDSEGKGNKNYNISTMSLPNLSTHSKVPIMGRNFSKIKFTKK